LREERRLTIVSYGLAVLSLSPLLSSPLLSSIIAWVDRLLNIGAQYYASALNPWDVARYPASLPSAKQLFLDAPLPLQHHRSTIYLSRSLELLDAGCSEICRKMNTHMQVNLTPSMNLISSYLKLFQQPITPPASSAMYLHTM